MQTLHSLSLFLLRVGSRRKKSLSVEWREASFFCLTTLGFPFLPFRSITFFGGLFFWRHNARNWKWKLFFFRRICLARILLGRRNKTHFTPAFFFCSCRKAHSEKQAFIWRLFCAVFRRKGGEKSVEGTTSEWEKRGGRQRDKTRRSRKGHLKEGSKQKRVSLTCGMGFNKIYFTKKSTQTYCQLEGTSGKKGKLCDMFETVC